MFERIGCELICCSIDMATDRWVNRDLRNVKINFLVVTWYPANQVGEVGVTANNPGNQTPPAKEEARRDEATSNHNKRGKR